MNIPNIKQLADKSPVDEVRGTIEKQYPPTDQTENDIKFGQHRQSILINDGSGEKLMVSLMKEQLHILDPCEGSEIIICAGTNEKGDSRGIVFNTWQQSGKSYPNTSVRVYPEATFRILPAGGATQVAVAPQATPDKSSASPRASTGFDEELALAAYGYCKCLDMAEEIVADRPLLKTDSESVRAIATNLWMSSKHKAATLAPDLMGVKTVVSKGAQPAPAPAAPLTSKVSKLDDIELVKKCIAGHEADDSGKLDDKGKAFLVAIDEEIESRELWGDAYDAASENWIDGGHKLEVDTVFDDMAKSLGVKSPLVEKFIVCSPHAWSEKIVDQIGRNA